MESSVMQEAYQDSLTAYGFEGQNQKKLGKWFHDIDKLITNQWKSAKAATIYN